MISHKHKAIFVHIPKTGGTSISQALDHFEGSPVVSQDHRSIRMIQPLPTQIKPATDNGMELMRRLKHNLTAKSKNLNKVTREQYQNYYKFSLVRNPWSRAYSWYRALQRDTKLGARRGVTEITTLYDALKSNIGKGMLKPQTCWLKNYMGDIDLDFVGRFEDLNNDSQRVFKKLGIVRDLPPPRRVIRKKIDYRTQFDTASTDLIAEAYAEEIELFNYSFD